MMKVSRIGKLEVDTGVKLGSLVNLKRIPFGGFNVKTETILHLKIKGTNQVSSEVTRPTTRPEDPPRYHNSITVIVTAFSTPQVLLSVHEECRFLNSSF